MAWVSLRYRFRQRLDAAVGAAYAWCTDFGPEDGRLFSEPTVRSVRWLTADAVVMTDTTSAGGTARRIRRLVRLAPERHAWTSTHLDGPFRGSQYWYQLTADGAQRCYLDFEGLRLERLVGPGRPAVLRRRAAARRRADSEEWRVRFAPALARDCRPTGHP